MPRIRTYKPDFFKSLDVSALPLRARLTWLGLWTQCDDHGRFLDHVKLVKAEVWPLDDVSLRDVADDLDTLADHGRIVRYTVGDRDYLAVQNWHHHQSINRPAGPKYPDPPEPIAAPAPGESGHCPHCWHLLTEGSVSIHGALREASRQEGKGKEGKGGDARERADPPPRTCPKHQNTTNPPACGACKDARQAYERWEGQQRDEKASTRDELSRARADPSLLCEHGQDGGLHVRSDTGERLCPFCRRAERSAS